MQQEKIENYFELIKNLLIEYSPKVDIFALNAN